jgi:hypothetical protein
LPKDQVFGTSIEIIKGKFLKTDVWPDWSIDKLFWICNDKSPINIKNAFYFNIDNDLTYFPFNKDFGPLNLAMVHRYVRELQRLLKDEKF